MKLTAMQEKIYRYIQTCVRENGYPPSVREVCAEMNLKSSSTAHFHLKNLEKAGCIAIHRGKGRAITLLEPSATETARQIPILGAVAAGSPILAQEYIEGYLPLDWTKRGDFALRVRGESMLDAGIYPGDYVIVRRQPEANSGEIVVALIGDEATVKRYSLRDGQVWLLPANDAYSPIDGSEARIIGIVTAVARLYERA